VQLEFISESTELHCVGELLSSGNQFCLDGLQPGLEIDTLSYSCYANGQNDVSVLVGEFAATDHNITVDPQFVDAAKGDYRLLSSSPCVDAGHNDFNTEPYDIRGFGFPAH